MSDDLDDIRIIMDLPRLGELTAHIAATFAQMRDVEVPDWDGEEGRAIALASWQYACFMSDRAEFARSVNSDLAALEESPFVPVDPNFSTPKDSE